MELTYVIEKKYVLPFLRWSKDKGWVRTGFDVFSEEERLTYKRPFGSYWVLYGYPF